MKSITLLCLAALLASCSSPTNKAGTDTIINSQTIAKAKDTKATNNTPTIYSLCFLRTEGNAHKDSTSVELVIRGKKVTGTMDWLPYQKDRRKGTLAGTIKNDTLKAIWRFMQEGMKDTLMLNFRFKDSQLAQKPLMLNAKTGRQQTDETKGYTLKYNSSSAVK